MSRRRVRSRRAAVGIRRRPLVWTAARVRPRAPVNRRGAPLARNGDGAGRAHDALAALAVDARARLVAALARRVRDIGLAEDAVAEAFRQALEAWPRQGVPDRAEAWLLTVARRRLIDDLRRSGVRTRFADATIPPTLAELAMAPNHVDALPDERLGLMLAATHPALDASVHAPLILQVVLGVPADRIAAAFLVPAATMSQRLVRAKAKIRDAGIPFDVPDRRHWPARFGGLLDAVYTAYTTSWNGDGDGDAALAADALHLSAVLLRVAPDEPEAMGLRALLLHTEARRPARRDAYGRYVPLTEQDPARWDAALAAEANTLLGLAARRRAPGRFQLEAAIQGAMSARDAHGRPPWARVVDLYDALLGIAPSVGAAVGRAAAIGEAYSAPAGLVALDAVAGAQDYQPAHATRAALLRGAGRLDEARAAYDAAIAGATRPDVRAWLRAQRPG